MSCCIVLFRTKDRSHFKNPVIYAYHGLFIKLGTLAQLCLLIKIVQFKYIGAAFCSAGYNLWCTDFRKILGMEKVPKPSYNAFLKAELSPFHGISKGNRTQSQLSL